MGLGGPNNWSLTAEPPSWVLECAEAERWPEGTLERRQQELRRLGQSILYAYFTETGTLSWIEAGALPVDIDWTDAAPLDSALNKVLKQLREDQEKRSGGS